MALEVVWTGKAKQNLFTTLEYLEKDWSSRIASEFYTETIVKIELVKIFRLSELNQKEILYPTHPNYKAQRVVL